MNDIPKLWKWPQILETFFSPYRRLFTRVVFVAGSTSTMIGRALSAAYVNNKVQSFTTYVVTINPLNRFAHQSGTLSLIKFEIIFAVSSCCRSLLIVAVLSPN